MDRKKKIELDKLKNESEKVKKMRSDLEGKEKEKQWDNSFVASGSDYTGPN